MSEFLKTLTANFATVDLAELAARDIKNQFSQIKTITIKYKNIPEPFPNSHRDIHTGSSGTAFLAGAAMGNGLGSGYAGGYPGFFPVSGTVFVGYENHRNHSEPEPEESTESRLIIKAGESQIKRIEDHLRSLGGLHITIS